ncbi:hypothetical protein HRI_005122200 [Hibiscus trionum]|uniref:Uncharacterized protein ycf33 n=1 Tax=Hibiscus trionum TaxID=183268 RepID=A0A9W7MWC0_HIBTR|nr:hypothetical protein HRI_005122200 [Hibiscus trionum]
MKVHPLIVTTHSALQNVEAIGTSPKSLQLSNKMKTSPLKLPTIFHPLQPPTTRIITFKTHSSNRRLDIKSRSTPPEATAITDKPVVPVQKRGLAQVPSSGFPRFVVVGAVSVGLAWFLMEVDVPKALALGPEGPLMEEFWENVRRYALYALTVSTGAIYTIMLPILELLKNPISAVLILLILGGGIFLVSQILSAMVGVSDFSYSYAY